MDFDMYKFGERLKKARIASGKSQTALGTIAGLSAQAISAYEKGKQKPAIDAAAILADALGVSLDDLCGIEKKQAEEPLNKETAEASGRVFKNYADVVEHLAALSRFFHCSCGTKEFDLPEEEWSYGGGDFLETTYTRAAFYITDWQLVDFIRQWSKMYQLYREGVIQGELLETWYRGMLSKLAETDLSKNTLSNHHSTPLLFGFDFDTGEKNGK